jgi:hypothetical protein
MTDTNTITCPTCGTPNQHVGKFCEQCGIRVDAPVTPAPDVSPATVDQSSNVAAPPSTPAATPPAWAVPDPAPTPSGTAGEPTSPQSEVRFILVSGGTLDMTRSFTVPLSSKLLVGRTDLSNDPARRTVPDVDLTTWAKRVQTGDGPLYTIHRRQCYISRDTEGTVWLTDYPDYPGDTFINPTGTADYKTATDLGQDRRLNAEGGVELRSGDRILMGQGEGMLTFQMVTT